jgi:acyl-coenzyme A synthetase/AMP-(fatty) acid ligase
MSAAHHENRAMSSTAPANWIDLPHLLLASPADREVAVQPSLALSQLREQALRLAGGLQACGIRRLAVHLEDAGELAIALLGAWRAGVWVLLPADLQTQNRSRLAGEVDLWLSDQPGDTRLSELLGAPLPAAALDLDHVGLSLCTSGSSGEPKLIDKPLAQLSAEVQTLEALWGADLGQARVLGSVATQHLYGLLFRLLWPLCAGRPVVRHALPFPEELQRASLAIDHDATLPGVASDPQARHTLAGHSARAYGQTEPTCELAARPAAAMRATASDFVWVASPALLKRMADTLDWPALRQVRRVFSSGGALPADAALLLQQRLGQWPTEIYGSSETGGIAWRQGDAPWQPLPGVELSQDQSGALAVATPWLAAGHLEQTADAVSLQADGRFALLGRLDRIVKLEEKRISLPLLERALAEHAWVDEARLGLLQERRAFLGALVALSPAGLHMLRNQGRRALTEGLRQHLKGHCEALALPRRWRFVRQLPGNTQGKLPQAELQVRLEEPRPTQPQLLSQQQQDGQWRVELQVPVDLAHFSGHFPQTPVLPGVVQIDWALQLARQLLDLPAHFVGIEVLKFQQLARPGDRLQLQLRFDAERSKLHFSFRQDDAPCSSGRILLAATRP